MDYRKYIKLGTLASKLLREKKIFKPDGGMIETNTEPTDREKAMAWWNEMHFVDKGLLMDGDFEYRHPQSLTGREIEKLWKQNNSK